VSASTAISLEDAAAHLASRAGAENICLQEEAIAATPTGEPQMAEILRFANEQRLVVTPTGAGTKLSWGNPVAAQIRLSTARMNTVREHSWQDMTCTVEAGCTWAAMQAALARHGQMVALDPLWPEHATVGGIVAANDGGAMRIKYGGLRDLIIGMTVVLADGTIAKTGGKVVKNVAGYDLHKLMTGSFGTLGMIASVNFRLHPVEEHARTWTATAPDASHFEAPLRALLDAQIVPSCVQMRAKRGECSIDIRIAAVPHCLDELAVRLQSIFSQIALRATEDNVWRAQQQLFDGDESVILKLSLVPSQICAVLAEMQSHADTEKSGFVSVAQANGLATVAFNDAPDAALARIERLRAHLHDSGGSAVALRVPDELRSRIDVWGCDANALPLMREIKRRFDPNRILNPGRYVGNI
jgi:glycolate oxidase FAD binding subunit